VEVPLKVTLIIWKFQ